MSTYRGSDRHKRTEARVKYMRDYQRAYALKNIYGLSVVPNWNNAGGRAPLAAQRAAVSPVRSSLTARFCLCASEASAMEYSHA